jgi:nitrate reductase cytochrome c-type subunit
MKNTGKCCKCGSTSIAVISKQPTIIKANYYDEFIPYGKTLLSFIPVSRYVCTDCGYIEQWVEDSENLNKVKDKYLK